MVLMVSSGKTSNLLHFAFDVAMNKEFLSKIIFDNINLLRKGAIHTSKEAQMVKKLKSKGKKIEVV